MVTQTDPFKCIVTALFFTVGYSLPVSAQETLIDELYQELAEADTASQERIENQIITEWGKSGSAAMDLLMRRGKDAMEQTDYVAASEHFSALVDHAPDFAEGYYGRASAYYFLGRVGPALDDIQRALVINPRHFEAMRGLAIIMEDLQRPADALELYQMILVINPQSGEVQDAVARLELQLEGQSL
jgi:tetratricopeptide (TPR) repeat protein